MLISGDRDYGSRNRDVSEESFVKRELETFDTYSEKNSKRSKEQRPYSMESDDVGGGEFKGV
ncbi:hypothetical protein FRX31_025095 [Thalictrum thalictroides]|uniref:Uncharacterized protein n=1 Tax=Thalictrum thalictroides TaxID=46969 RepID=A0A7J6VKM3_THATH|nr:hypothetical protein FRX31_025095 [Thalictrum thalictroides]